MRIFRFILYLLLLTTTQAFASNTSKLDKIKELMKVEGLYEEIDQQKKYCQEQANAIGSQMDKQLKSEFPEFDESLFTALDKAYKKFIEAARPTWTTEEVINLFAEYYGSNITEDEIDKILSFYKSSIGQKDIQATKIAIPKLTNFFTEKNKIILERATQSYVDELKKIIDYQKSKLNK